MRRDTSYVSMRHTLACISIRQHEVFIPAAANKHTRTVGTCAAPVERLAGRFSHADADSLVEFAQGSVTT
jgi:hypothetical protein